MLNISRSNVFGNFVLIVQIALTKCGRILWQNVLKEHFGRMFWQNVLAECFGRTLWQNALAFGHSLT